MRKEQLINVKRNLVSKKLAYTGLQISDNELAMFSVKQLESLCDIMKRNKELVENRQSFLSLSTTEVLCKENDRIVDFDYKGTGEIKEVSHDYVMNGAARMILKEYTDGK